MCQWYIPLMQTPSNLNTQKLMNPETFTTCKPDLDVVISAVYYKDTTQTSRRQKLCPEVPSPSGHKCTPFLLENESHKQQVGYSASDKLLDHFEKRPTAIQPLHLGRNTLRQVQMLSLL